jgi:hypothetical protein
MRNARSSSKLDTVSPALPALPALSALHDRTPHRVSPTGYRETKPSGAMRMGPSRKSRPICAWRFCDAIRAVAHTERRDEV